MNLSKSLKYQIFEYVKPTIIFYFVMVCITILCGVAVNSSSELENSQYQGMEMVSIIFLFILGLNSFKDTFRLFLQNSLSRKTLFIGRIISIFIVSVGMVIIDTCLLFISKAVFSNYKNFQVIGLFEQFFNNHINHISKLQMIAENILLLVCVYLSAAFIGYFITVAYYRMSKTLKTVVSIGIPVTATFLLPMFDTFVTKGKISKFIYDFVTFALGTKGGKPYNAMITFGLVAILFGGLSWALIRKAVDKND
jgi:hypothetical protein